MPGAELCGMADVLESKRAATRFRILVEIAERQPAVNQGEIADAVGITSQAVSEYIQTLVEDGLVNKEGRSRYRVTTEGVDWLLTQATETKEFVEWVTDDLLGGVKEDAAIATAPIEANDPVSLTLREGLLHASPGTEGPATGIATTDGDPGQEIGVTDFDGIIDLEPGAVTLLQVPTIQSGGSRNVDREQLQAGCADVDIVAAAGVESIVALRDADIPIDTTFGGGHVAADAASRGLTVAIAVTADTIGQVADPLRDAGIAYEVKDVANRQGE